MNKNYWEKIIESYVPNWKNHSDFNSTPDKVSKMYDEYFRNEDPSIHIHEVSPATDQQTITISNIKCIGLCPHHLLPIEYKINIAYVPHNKVLGLSRFTRIAKAITSFPKLQENITTELFNLIKENLDPIALFVEVTGEHGCIKFRGVCENTPVTTQKKLGDIEMKL